MTPLTLYGAFCAETRNTCFSGSPAHVQTCFWALHQCGRTAQLVPHPVYLVERQSSALKRAARNDVIAPDFGVRPGDAGIGDQNEYHCVRIGIRFSVSSGSVPTRPTRRIEIPSPA